MMFPLSEDFMWIYRGYRTNIQQQQSRATPLGSSAEFMWCDTATPLLSQPAWLNLLQILRANELLSRDSLGFLSSGAETVRDLGRTTKTISRLGCSPGAQLLRGFLPSRTWKHTEALMAVRVEGLLIETTLKWISPTAGLGHPLGVQSTAAILFYKGDFLMGSCCFQECQHRT